MLSTSSAAQVPWDPRIEFPNAFRQGQALLQRETSRKGWQLLHATTCCNWNCNPGTLTATRRHLVAVVIHLKRSLHLHANVLSLLLGELGEACSQGWQVQRCHLLIQLLGQQVHIILVLLGLGAIL